MSRSIEVNGALYQASRQSIPMEENNDYVDPTLFWLSEGGAGVTVEAVLNSIQTRRAAYLEGCIEDLILENHDALGWNACYRNIPVTHQKNKTWIGLEDEVVKNPYLCRRLANVNQISVFHVSADPAMGDRLAGIKEALDSYLFSMINSYCFNRGFEHVVLQITENLPKGAKLFMDNPGIHPEWGLHNQSLLFKLLFREQAERRMNQLLKPDGFFKNAYSMAGIIYTPNQTASTRTEIHYMDGRELTTVLYQSAGVI